MLACQEPVTEYKSFNNKLSYKLIQLGDGAKPKGNEVIELNMILLKENGDTLYYVPNYNYFIPIQSHVLDSVWQQFNVGDSVKLKLSSGLFSSYLKLYKVMQEKESTVSLQVRIVNSYDSLQAIQAQQQQLSKRELEEQKNLNVYLKEFNDSLEKVGGVYKQVLKRTDGNEIIAGSEVSIHYQGKFLNGFVFDDTYDKSITPSFTYGQEYQMIDGLRAALKGMKEGESVKIILPSRHAFGEEGSLAGIVPPYTAVIYEVNIIKVIN